MRIVKNPDQLLENIQRAKSEAKNAFGDDTLIIEKYFEDVK